MTDIGAAILLLVALTAARAIDPLTILLGVLIGWFGRKPAQIVGAALVVGVVLRTGLAIYGVPGRPIFFPLDALGLGAWAFAVYWLKSRYIASRR